MTSALLRICEIGATYIEIFLLYCYYDLSLSPRRFPKKIFLVVKQVSIVCLTIFITMMNKVTIFSYFTFYSALIVYACVALISYDTKFLAKKTYSSFPETILYFFSLLFVENFFSPILVLVFDVNTVKQLVFSTDFYRILHLVLNKLFNVFIFLLLKKMKKNKSVELKPEYAFYIAIVTLFLGFLTITTYNTLFSSYLKIHKYAALSISFLFLSVYGGMFWMAINFTKISVQSENDKINRLKLQNLQIELNALTQSNIEKSKILHDTKNQILVIRQLAKENQMEVLDTYLQEYTSSISKVHNYIKTGSNVVDVILNHRISEARQKNIDVECNILKLDIIDLNPMDICSILTNLLDNAIEACEKQNKDSQKLIQIEIKRKHDFIYIKISNTVQSPPKITHNRILTTKSDSSIHGFGLQIVQDCVQKYMGSVAFSFEPVTSTFTASVTLCIEQA